MRRVGIVGAGNIGGMRARILLEHPFVDEVLVTDTDAEAADRLAAEVPGVVATDPDRLLADPDVLGYVVATRSAGQAAVTPTLLGAGLPVLVEKPFTGDPGAAARLVDTAAAHGAPLYAGYTQRFRPRFLTGHRQLREGACGHVVTVSARFLSTRAVAGSALAKASTTPVRTLSPHLLDLVTWYLGGRLPDRVTGSSIRTEVDGRETTGTSWALLEYADGVTVGLTVGWQLPAHHPAFHASLSVEVLGDAGVLSIDDLHTEGLVTAEKPISMASNPYTGSDGHRAAFLGSYPPGDAILGRMFGPVRDETNAFVEILAGAPGHPVLATGAEAHRTAVVVRMVDEATRSAGELATAPR